MTQYNPPPPGGYAPPPPGGPVPYGAPQPSPAMAITSMVLGILSIVTSCFWFLAIPLGIAAIVIAILVRPKIARGEASGRGMATAGMITGGIGLLISIVLVIIAITAGQKIQDWAEEQQRLQQQQQQQSAP